MIALNGLLRLLFIRGRILKPMGKNACFSSQMSLLSGGFYMPLCFLETQYILLAHSPSCVLFTRGSGGVSWSPQSLGQSNAPSSGAAAQVMPELEGCQFALCTSTAQLNCHHHLGTVTSPSMSALIRSQSQVMSHASCKMSGRHLCGFLFLLVSRNI